ncbi:MAG: glycosyltransferase family 2 protein [Desulfurivibrio sp.]|nr:glycosyltransferase family 2 protein [Desulfurivibrio sp.]
MRISVIITTYNAPAWLEKVLWGYSVQLHKDFELIIGDDGSSAETRELIERMRDETRMDIKHVWQQDKGFRKCRILNKAILAAAAEYVVFSDGDCIPRNDFLAVHAAEAEPGRFLSGGYQKLPMPISKAISKEDILTGRCFDLKWLKVNGLKRSLKNAKLITTHGQARIFNNLTITKCTLKGANASVWRKDIFAVNGFDERMAWGGLDRELGVRLVNYGIRPKHVRYNAIVLHLDHERGYKDPEMVASNKKLRIFNVHNRINCTEHGISQLPTEKL